MFVRRIHQDIYGNRWRYLRLGNYIVMILIQDKKENYAEKLIEEIKNANID